MAELQKMPLLSEPLEEKDMTPPTGNKAWPAEPWLDFSPMRSMYVHADADAAQAAAASGLVPIQNRGFFDHLFVGAEGPS